MALLGRTSDNTLCLQHLIPILISLVRQNDDCERYAQYEPYAQRWSASVAGHHGPADPIPSHAANNPTDRWWDSADAWHLFDRLIDILTDQGFLFFYNNYTEGAQIGLGFEFTFALDALASEEAMMDAAIARDVDIETLPDLKHGEQQAEGEGTCQITRSPWHALAAGRAAKARRKAYVSAYFKARHERILGNPKSRKRKGKVKKQMFGDDST